MMRSFGSCLVFATIASLAACGGSEPAGASDDSTSAKDGGTGVNDGGTSVDSATATCAGPADCPAPADACVVAVCKGGSCTTENAPNGASCDDGSACTKTDTCQEGQCAGAGQVVCTAVDDCHDVGVCSPATGTCSSPTKTDGADCAGGGKCVSAACVQPVVVLARQDFELTPAMPTWGFTGPVVYESGTSSASAGPPNSPIGIGGSRAWNTTAVSAGIALDFANVTVPAGFDRVRLRFRLAAMNLVGASGGPDNLDYVLVAYSLDGGTTYVDRLRVRGAANDNCFWGYDATGVASVEHLPASETVIAPTESGLQTTKGYSTVEILFPGTVTQVRARITARSSSGTDTWLIDDVTLTGENDLP